MRSLLALQRPRELALRLAIVPAIGFWGGFDSDSWPLLPTVLAVLVSETPGRADEERRNAEFLVARGVARSRLGGDLWTLSVAASALGLASWWVAHAFWSSAHASRWMPWLSSLPHQAILVASVVAVSLHDRSRSLRNPPSHVRTFIVVAKLLAVILVASLVSAGCAQGLGIPSWSLTLPACVVLTSWCYVRSRDALYDFDRIDAPATEWGVVGRGREGRHRAPLSTASPARRNSGVVLRLVHLDVRQLAHEPGSLLTLLLCAVAAGWLLAWRGEMPGRHPKLTPFLPWILALASFAGITRLVWGGAGIAAARQRTAGSADLAFLLARPVSRAQVFAAHTITLAASVFAAGALAAVVAATLGWLSPDGFSPPSMRFGAVALTMVLAAAALVAAPLPRLALGLLRGSRARLLYAGRMLALAAIVLAVLWSRSREIEAGVDAAFEASGMALGLAIFALAAGAATLGWRTVRRLEP